jgi:hypothetical protein
MFTQSRHLSLCAGIATAALLIGWAAAAGAQGTNQSGPAQQSTPLATEPAPQEQANATLPRRCRSATTMCAKSRTS